MPRFKPEANTLLGPGTHTVEIVGTDEYDLPDGSWDATVVEFTCKAGRIKDRATLKTAWKFRRLAEAIGDDAVEVYEAEDGAGYSKFDPKDFIGRRLNIVVEEYEWNGKASVRVKDWRRLTKVSEEAWAAPKKTDHGHKAVEEDDIPF
jgi:hypothetical protein